MLSKYSEFLIDVIRLEFEKVILHFGIYLLVMVREKVEEVLFLIWNI